MVLNLGTSLEQVLKVALPARRVLAIAEAACLGPIEHLLDAAAQARPGLRGARPDRLKELDDRRRVDIGDVELAESGVGLREARAPLRAVLVVTEARQVLLEICCAALREGHGTCGRLERGLALGLGGSGAVLDRIGAQLDQTAGGAGEIPGIGKADRIARPQPHPTRLARHRGDEL